MSAPTRRTLRLKFITSDPVLPGLVLDDDNGKSPSVWRSEDLEINVAVFDAQEPGAPMDLTDFDTLTIELRPEPRRTDGVFWSKTSALVDATLTAAEFTDGSKKHATFDLTDDEMRLDLLTDNTRRFWVVLGGTNTSDDFIFIAAGGPFVVTESGFNSGGTAVALSGDFGTGTVDAGAMSEVVTFVGMTSGGYVNVQKTSEGPAIDRVVYGSGSFEVFLTGPAQPGGVTFKYHVLKVS
jgi:hypothetical protein